MRLADDEITLRIGNETIFLRPSLRAAFRLERRYGGFDKIARSVTDGNLTVISDVIRESTDTPSAIPDLLCEIGTHGLRVGLEALTVPVLSHVLALAGVEEEHDGPEAEPAGDRITFADYHAKLYRIATGWLGWTPETAWNATPAEIIEAHAGRVEMLGALFGTGNGRKTGEPDFERDEQGWESLKMIAAAGGNRGF